MSINLTSEQLRSGENIVLSIVIVIGFAILAAIGYWVCAAFAASGHPWAEGVR